MSGNVQPLYGPPPQKRKKHFSVAGVFSETASDISSDGHSK